MLDLDECMQNENNTIQYNILYLESTSRSLPRSEAVPASNNTFPHAYLPEQEQDLMDRYGGNPSCSLHITT